MSFKNLKAFLNALDQAGELKYIHHTVSPHLEISKLTERESKHPKGGKALFFKNVKGSAFPVATNIFGSPRRIAMALGVHHLDELGDRVRKFIHFNPPRNLKEALNIIPMGISLANFFPRRTKAVTPPCQQVVHTGDQVDLSKIPVLHCWPKDAGPFITLPLVFTRSLVTRKRNAGMYRMQVFNGNTTGMHWHVHKDGAHYYHEYLREDKRMPVAVAIGADPATIYAATAPLPRGVDEMMLAGFIRKKPVTLAKCITVDMEIPAEAEIVLEGYVNPGEFRREGPFGDHTGYYSLADDYPVFHVTAVTHRKNAIYSATLVGRPPMEDCYMAKATERLFLPMIQAVMPEILDYWFPWEGVFHNIVVVSMDKEYPGHVQKLMCGLWGQGQMSFSKAIVVVDRDTNPQDPESVLKALLKNFDPTSDVTLTRGILDVLDHASPVPCFGYKIGIDLTGRLKGEQPRAEKNSVKNPAPEDSLFSIVKRRVHGLAGCRHLLRELSASLDSSNRILALSFEKTAHAGCKQLAALLLDPADLDVFNIFIVFDEEIDLCDNSLMLWKLFNNVDPGRDIIFRGNRLVIDACKKGPMDGHNRQWPDELTFDEQQV
jgi:4-hydroxy-3-polyprenylbenzoate decarboxylase